MPAITIPRHPTFRAPDDPPSILLAPRVVDFAGHAVQRADGGLRPSHTYSPPGKMNDSQHQDILAGAYPRRTSLLDGAELRAYNTKNADICAHDAVCLTDPTILKLLAKNNMKRISFRELRELQRAGN